ncbi:MAG TPA: PRC-barrel domain-containing protein [Desulfosarcina sp.]|nr:PRC-barrel domain-containing protein [Desulfosarcina sp.]
MLRSLRDIQGYVLNAQDGEIGKCSDFLFDDQNWAVRYLVADTMKWLPGRKVLISPISIGDADGITRRLNVGLSKSQIKESPPLDSDAPVSRQYEIAFNKYHDWANYWGGSSVWGTHLHPRMLNRPGEARVATEITDENPHLRSTREVRGYHIQASDTDIGHVEDFIVDQDTWIIRYLIIDTKNWLPASKKVLVAPNWVDQVDWKRSRVVMELSSDQIENSPEYDPALPVNREYEVRLYDFYGRPHYW